MKRGSSLAEVEELAAKLPSPEQLKLAARICERLATRSRTGRGGWKRAYVEAWLKECDAVAESIEGSFDSVEDLRRIRAERT
jgi:hypothetical protein